MAKKNNAKPGSRKTVTIDLDKLRQAIEEQAPRNPGMAVLERALREGEFLTGGPEIGLVREMTLELDTCVGRGEADRLRQDIDCMISFWTLLKTLAESSSLHKISNKDIFVPLAEEAIEKLYFAKHLLKHGRADQR